MGNRNLHVVILAAGLGTRMKSSTIKVLHAAAGRPLIDYVLDLAGSVSDQPPVLIVGHQRDRVEAACAGRARFAEQKEQLGTGHALLQASSELESEDDFDVLVLSGDVPLTRPETLQHLLERHRSDDNAVTMLTMELDDPGRYGRIVRGRDGGVEKIVEAKDAGPEQLQIGEVNAGVYVFRGEGLFDDLRSLSSDNAQGEYYLTDLIAIARDREQRVGAVVVDPEEVLGVNSRADLSEVERVLQSRHLADLMTAGVTFRNPAAVTVDSTVAIGRDSIIYPFVTLEGSTVIGEDCVIGPGAHLKNTVVGNGVTVRSGTVAEDAEIGDGASVGPYAHLRPGTQLGRKVKIGNFVETKKATFGEGAKASHLSYIGDAEIGADVNIGAGTITCNYDGVRKHRTVLEDGVFIGSDTQLVAPVRVGRGAYVGAGSTITKDVPPDSLALSRSPQKTVQGWAAKKREEMKRKA